MRERRPERSQLRIRTMEEFSAASGISRPTLSRFFNDPESVRASSRARIEAAIERFGYRPNLFATNFNRRRPRTIGIVVPSVTDPFYAGLVQRLERLAGEAGYWTVLQNAQGDAEREAEAVETLMSLNVAGAIAVPLGHASKPGLYEAMSAAMPVVFLDARAEADGAFVGTDNRQSMGLMVDYLLRSGAAPRYFDMPDVNQNARERRRAYEAAMAAHGTEPVVVESGGHDWAFERIAHATAAALFNAGPAAGTILCANDRIAFGVMAAASEARIAVDREGGLRIAGHDDHPLSRYACPSLTTVAQDGERLAERGLQLLMQGVAEGSSPRGDHLVEARLMMRRSA